MIQSIVLAFTAIEAFANETIPSDYIYGRHHRSEIILQAVGKTEIERRITIDEKLCEVLPDVLKCKSPKGSSCWQAYKKLRETRDRIIHMKTEDRRSSGPEIETIWKAIVTSPAPHRAAKSLIEHFGKSMEVMPKWLQLIPPELR